MTFQIRIPNDWELYALCVDDTRQYDSRESVSLNHLYKVLGFVENKYTFPYGVRLCTAYKELNNLFYMQRFHYFWVNLN